MAGAMRFAEYEKMSPSLERFKELDQASRKNGLLLKKSWKAEFFKDLPEKITEIFKEVQKLKCDVNVGQVIVFGELFGGKYVHPDLKATKGKPVQIEIQYCPDIKLITYDIAYRRVNENGEFHEQEFLDYSDAMNIFEKFDMLYVKPLFKGKANDALNYKIGFDSTILMQLGLPKLAAGTNVAEGIVVRPLKNILAVGPFGDLDRLMIKIKVPQFDETRKQKGDKKGKGSITNRPDKQLIPIMVRYITENRMVSAGVKTGHPDTEEIEQKIKEEFMEDVMTEMLEDENNLTLWESCDPNQKQTVKRCLQDAKASVDRMTARGLDESVTRRGTFLRSKSGSTTQIIFIQKFISSVEWHSDGMHQDTSVSVAQWLSQ
eukprot:gene6659-7411_t